MRSIRLLRRISRNRWPEGKKIDPVIKAGKDIPSLLAFLEGAMSQPRVNHEFEKSPKTHLLKVVANFGPHLRQQLTFNSLGGPNFI